MLGIIHYLPDVLLVALSCWLGMSLLVRAPHDPATRVFAWFCLNLAIYTFTSLLPLLTASHELAELVNRMHLMAAAICSTAFGHFTLTLTARGQSPRWAQVLVGGFYILAITWSLYAAVGPLEPQPLARPTPEWVIFREELRFPDGPLAVGWVGVRALPMLMGIVLLGLAYWQHPHDDQERRLRAIYGFVGLIGAGGGLLAVAARDLNLSPALPRALILIAMLALAYAVLAHRALLPVSVARRTFFYSILGGLAATGYVALVLLLERLVAGWLQLEVPLVAPLSLVILVAILEPLRNWVRDQLDQYFYRREFDYVHLMRSLGNDMLERGNLSEQVQAALSVICRALGIDAGLVIVATSNGLEVQATYGEIEPAPLLDWVEVPDQRQWLEPGAWVPWPPARLLVPLRQGEDRLGLLVLGPQHVPQPFRSSEQSLLDYVNRYLALAISHAHARSLQQDVIIALAEQSKTLRAEQEELARKARIAASKEPKQPPPPPANANGLRVFALGPFRVERSDTPIGRWGGSKAGTYQAEALFAFLFDRIGRGVSKDEVAEVIWPDLDIERADSAFHRTLAGLRRTLEPGLRRGNLSQAVLYHHERYWLAPELIAWADTTAFLAAAEQGLNILRQQSALQALPTLEQAAQLYRGDYMDDCPFFGDSAHVEARRVDLRTRHIEVLLALGVAYEAAGRAGDAASAYRQALNQSIDDCPPARAGLARLQAVV